MAARQERIDAFIHEGHRQRTNRSRSCAKIASVRTSFRIYANGPRALGKMRKHADVSKPRYDRLAGVAGHAELGQLDEAWRCIGEALSIIETAKERWFEAEVNRIAGEIALKSPEPDAAKPEAYFDRALAVARQQQAKSWELRAAMSMARLWRDQGKREEARELLAPVYGWFTEGFDTLDLREAKALLDELA
jgi:predicted ATPase